MAQVQFDVPYSDHRSRGTVAIRIILAIPHFVLLTLWGYVVELVSFFHWLVQVFTGKRHSGMYAFSENYLTYLAHVSPYAGLLFDEYPGFIDDAGKTPVQFALADGSNDSVNRLTVLLRIIWAIPAVVILAVVGIGGYVLTILSWFVVIITGKMPEGWFRFLVKYHRFSLQVTAYGLLLTDDYPAYG